MVITDYKVLWILRSLESYHFSNDTTIINYMVFNYSDKLLAIYYHNYLVTVTSLLHNTLHNTYREFSSCNNLELPSWCKSIMAMYIYMWCINWKPHKYVYSCFAFCVVQHSITTFSLLIHQSCHRNFYLCIPTWQLFSVLSKVLSHEKNSVGPPYTTEIEMFSFCNTLFVSVSLAHIGSTYLADSIVALI